MLEEDIKNSYRYEKRGLFVRDLLKNKPHITYDVKLETVTNDFEVDIS